MRNNTKEKTKHSILLIGIIIIIIGVVLLLVTIIFSLWYQGRYQEGLALEVCTVLDNFVMCIGTSLIAIGAGTALYSYFDFVNYMQEKIKNVIIEHNFTDNLSDEQKKELASKLEKQILHQSEGTDLYDFVQEEILSMAKQAYYEEFILNVACWRENGEIRKKICKKYIMNCSSEPAFDIAANNEFCICCKESGIEEAITDIKLEINGLAFGKEDFESTPSDTGEEVYNKRYQFCLKPEARQRIANNMPEEKTKKYHVQSECVSVVKEDDPIFSFRLFNPCKNTSFIFTYNSNEFKVMEEVFVFKNYENAETIGDKAIVSQHNKGSIFVKIDDWVLPGDGIVFTLSPTDGRDSLKTEKN